MEHAIELTQDRAPPCPPFYRMSPAELDEVQRQIEELLDQGFIRPSNSQFAAQVLFARKQDGSLRMCTDYRALNRITRRDQYPIPRMDDLFDRLHGAQFFSKLDLASGYHQVRVAEEDIPKTAFRTRYGLFEFLVLPFGLCNAPATFMRLMNHTFSDYLDKFVLIYLDDLLVFSRTFDEHLHHLDAVLSRLEAQSLYLKASKCEFARHSTDFLGHTVTKDGICMQSAKVLAIQEWPPPTSIPQLRSFLGLVNYYRRFIPHCASTVAPLEALLRKDTPYAWGEPQAVAFATIKKDFTQEPTLLLPDPRQTYHLYVDASDFALGAILTQDQGKGRQPLAFFSRKLSGAERNYTTTMKELLAVRDACLHWRCYLENPRMRFHVYSDHRNLTFASKDTARDRNLTYWQQQLEIFNYQLHYIKGGDNPADPLSRRPDMELCVLTTRDALHQRIQTAYTTDPLYQQPPPHLQPKDGFYYCEETRLCIPDDAALRRTLVEEQHEPPYVGHFGESKTLQLVTKRYWWPSLRQDVHRFCATCQTCQRNTASNQRPAGLLQPLPAPEQLWTHVSVDFCSGLPTGVGGHDCI
ncbi:MAG: reverse transcriptase domain-containing protein, partial [Gaiellaceae bacterium]